MTAARKTKSKGSLAAKKPLTKNRKAEKLSTALDILRAARRLFDAPGSWTRGASARDPDNYAVDPWSRFACKWCAGGAIDCVVGAEGGQLVVAAEEALVKALSPGFRRRFGRTAQIVGFNDAECRRPYQIRAWFDRAIKLAAKEAREVASRGKAHA